MGLLANFDDVLEPFLPTCDVDEYEPDTDITDGWQLLIQLIVGSGYLTLFGPNYENQLSAFAAILPGGSLNPVYDYLASFSTCYGYKPPLPDIGTDYPVCTPEVNIA